MTREADQLLPALFRQKADLCRRLAAQIVTYGDPTKARLEAMAAELEDQAAQLIKEAALNRPQAA